MADDLIVHRVPTMHVTEPGFPHVDFAAQFFTLRLQAPGRLADTYELAKRPAHATDVAPVVVRLGTRAHNPDTSLRWRWVRLDFNRLEIVLVATFHGLPEIAHSLPQGAADLWELAGSKDDQRNDQDDDQFRDADAKHILLRSVVSRTYGWGFLEQAARQRHAAHTGRVLEGWLQLLQAEMRGGSGI